MKGGSTPRSSSSLLAGGGSTPPSSNSPGTCQAGVDPPLPSWMPGANLPRALVGALGETFWEPLGLQKGFPGEPQWRLSRGQPPGLLLDVFSAPWPSLEEALGALGTLHLQLFESHL